MGKQDITARDYDSLTSSMDEIKEDIKKMAADSTDIKVELGKINERFKTIDEKFVTKSSFTNAIRWAVVTAIGLAATLIAYLQLAR